MSRGTAIAAAAGVVVVVVVAACIQFNEFNSHALN